MQESDEDGLIKKHRLKGTWDNCGNWLSTFVVTIKEYIIIKLTCGSFIKIVADVFEKTIFLILYLTNNYRPPSFFVKST